MAGFRQRDYTSGVTDGHTRADMKAQGFDMVVSFKDILDSEAATTLWGRDRELATLANLLTQPSPLVQFVQGIPGIGKSALAREFARRSREAGASAIVLDCRAIEPTPQGLVARLAPALDCREESLEAIYRAIDKAARRVVLVFDSYELFRLLDTWLRETFALDLPSNARLVLVSRRRMAQAWNLQGPWRDQVASLIVGPLDKTAATACLTANGIDTRQVRKIASLCHGHPLALTMASTFATEGRLNATPSSTEDLLVGELSRFYLNSIEDATVRRAVEATSLLRRLTRPMLEAILGDAGDSALYDTLAELPFVDDSADGLFLHDSVRDAIAKYFVAHDPNGARAYKQTAWRVLRTEIRKAAPSQFWGYTADTIFLLNNPVVREAFFPDALPHVVVAPARPADHAALRDIIGTHEGPQGARLLERWLDAVPESFRVVRDDDDKVVGFYCVLDRKAVPAELLASDPVAAAWDRHVGDTRMPDSQIALFLRRWLARDHGEGLSSAQAACWLDIKRSYLELRPTLRRCYMTAHDLTPFADVGSVLGFVTLPQANVTLDGRTYRTIMLDLGPASVDGWLSGLLARELGVQEDGMLDPDTQEMIVGDDRVGLTPLEFKVMQYLRVRGGEAVTRDNLLDDVWGQHHHGGSNVVDAVIMSLRKKLGSRADALKTVRGIGYRLDA